MATKDQKASPKLIKVKNIALQTVVAIITLAGISYFMYTFNIMHEILLNLVFLGGLLFLNFIAFNKGYRNIGFGMLSGQLLTVSGLIVYLISVLIAKF